MKIRVVNDTMLDIISVLPTDTQLKWWLVAFFQKEVAKAHYKQRRSGRGQYLHEKYSAWECGRKGLSVTSCSAIVLWLPCSSPATHRKEPFEGANKRRGCITSTGLLLFS